MKVNFPRFERYEVRAILGRGGFATVYRAFDRRLGREVALKLMHAHVADDSRAANRFLEEAQRLAQLHHPSIVAVHDVDELDEVPFFTMELIEGQTLAQLVTPGEGLELPRLVELMTPLCTAVDYLHARGIIHRDIKAANAMLGSDGRVMLMDFGIARVMDEVGNTLTGQVLGTPEAMAPEQVRGEEVGPATDIYALGVLAYRLLSGQAPFTGKSTEVLYNHVATPPRPLPEVRPGLPAQIYEAVEAALAKRPEDRPATAAALATALARAVDSTDEAAARQHESEARQHTIALPAPRRRAARYWLAGAGSLLFLAVIVAVTVGLSRHSRPSARAAAPTTAGRNATPGAAGAARASSADTVVDRRGDDFTDSEQGLLPPSAAYTERPGFSVAYRNGEYVVKNTAASRNTSPAIPIDGTFAGAEFAVDAALAGDTAERHIVLQCGSTQLRVDPAAGMFTLIEFTGTTGDANTPLVDWRPSSAIRRGTNVNRLALRCADGQISAAINDQDVASVKADTSTVNGIAVGAGARTDAPVTVEMHLARLVVMRLSPAAQQGTATPAPAGWAAALHFVLPADQPRISAFSLTVGTATLSQNMLAVDTSLNACFTLDPRGTSGSLLAIISEDTGTPLRAPDGPGVISSSDPIALAAGGKCYAIGVAGKLKPLHAYRVDVFHGAVNLASHSFVEKPRAAQTILAQDLADPERHELGSDGEFAGWPGSRHSYLNGEYVARFDGQPAGANGGVPFTPVQDSPSNGAVALTAKLSGVDAGGVSVGCRNGPGGAYQALIYEGGGVTIVRVDRADRIRLIPIVPYIQTAALSLGAGPIQVVLRCVGSTIALTVNGRLVASVQDSTYAYGTFFFGPFLNADGKGEGHFSNLTFVAEQP